MSINITWSNIMQRASLYMHQNDQKPCLCYSMPAHCVEDYLNDIVVDKWMLDKAPWASVMKSSWKCPVIILTNIYTAYKICMNSDNMTNIFFIPIACNECAQDRWICIDVNVAFWCFHKRINLNSLLIQNSPKFLFSYVTILSCC